VPVDGSLISRVAVEFAMRYCETTDAALTVVVQVERWRFVENLAEEGDGARASDALPDPHDISEIRLHPATGGSRAR